MFFVGGHMPNHIGYQQSQPEHSPIFHQRHHFQHLRKKGEIIFVRLHIDSKDQKENMKRTKHRVEDKPVFFHENEDFGSLQFTKVIKKVTHKTSLELGIAGWALGIRCRRIIIISVIYRSWILLILYYL